MDPSSITIGRSRGGKLYLSYTSGRISISLPAPDDIAARENDLRAVFRAQIEAALKTIFPGAGS